MPDVTPRGRVVSHIRVEGDSLGPSEALRKALDYSAHAPETRALVERIADVRPTTLACMHRSAWRGDGRTLLHTLAGQLA